MDGGDRAEADLKFSVYVTGMGEEESREELGAGLLEEAISATNPSGPWRVTPTSCGLIAAFTLESDVLALLNTPLAQSLGCPVQVARFSSKDTRYKQGIILKDVPWAVPVAEIKTALEQQGILPLTVERIRQNVKVEVTDPGQYENLLQRGLDFYGATRFAASTDKWKNVVSRNGGWTTDENQQESVLQCYRCQGFWHIASNCQHMPRCVRCGEGHTVDMCRRPRDDPVCCHCGGRHHAAYKQCPVRLRLVNSTPMGIALSATKSRVQRLRRPLYTPQPPTHQSPPPPV